MKPARLPGDAPTRVRAFRARAVDSVGSPDALNSPKPHTSPNAHISPKAGGAVAAFSAFGTFKAFSIVAATCVCGAIPFLLTACDLPLNPIAGTERVTVELPAWPESWPQAIPPAGASRDSATATFRVSWYDADGSPREVTGVRDSAEIELDAGVFTPIVAEPESERMGIPRGFLPAAGAIYPVHARSSDGRPSIRCDWLRGIDARTAELACLGARGGFANGRAIASHFNWLKLDGEMATRERPLCVDARSMADAILSGRFSKRDVSEAKLVARANAVAMNAVPRQETFVPAWALATRGTATDAAKATTDAEDGAAAPSAVANGSRSFTTDENGRFSLDCPAGISRWFSRTGYLTVSATPDAITCAFFTRYDLRE